MPSLLRPTVLESCQTGLRRRNSITPLTAIPESFAESPSCTPEDNAVFDSNETDHHQIISNPVNSSTELVVPFLSPVTDAHMSDYASKITIPRHHNARTIATCDASSPTSASSLATPASCKPSFTAESRPEQVKLEKLRWRLASGFFAYFVCGWGDGGKLSKTQGFRRICSHSPRFSHWHCHPL